MILEALHDLVIVPLAELTLKKQDFNSSSAVLNSYLQTQAPQDEKRELAKCFVLINQKNEQIIGYYTLSATLIKVENIPKANIQKKIRYPNIPAVLVGRLAIDQRFVGQGYGKFLIADVLHKVSNAKMGIATLLVEAKDDNAIAFYKKLGFIP